MTWHLFRSLWPCNKPPPDREVGTATLLCSQSLWVRPSDRAQQGEFVSTISRTSAGNPHRPGITQRHLLSGLMWTLATDGTSGGVVHQNSCVCVLSSRPGQCGGLKGDGFLRWKLRAWRGGGGSQLTGGSCIAFDDSLRRHSCSVLSITSKSQVPLDSRGGKLDSPLDVGGVRF